jgi:DNA-binding transcriptional ArsR family regulator
MVERRAGARAGKRRNPQQLTRTFAALADPTRRSMLAQLRGGDATISELAAPFAVSFAAVSKHVQVLERAGLVTREVVGREHRLSLVAAPLREASEWTQDYRGFWEARLDALDAVLRASNAKPRRPARRPRSK